jgi:hypothetical protein
MPRLLAFMPAALLLACVSAEPASTEPDDPPPIVQLESEPQTEESPVSTTDGPEYFFAVASQVGVQHCPNGNFEWIGIQPTLGWVTTSGPPEAELEALMDLPVLARGSVGPRPERPPLQIDPTPCPEMQMRSDWVNTPRGTRARRTVRPNVEHFHMTSVRRLDELKVVANGDRVTASFENPLPFALTGVRLRMHYEGCYGKPGTTNKESESVTLQPGEKLEYEFPALDVREQKRVHRAAAIVLEIGGSSDDSGAPPEAKVWVDLDVSLYKLGVILDDCR